MNNLKIVYMKKSSSYHGNSVRLVDVPPIIRSFESIPQSAGKIYGAIFRSLDPFEFGSGQQTCVRENEMQRNVHTNS